MATKTTILLLNIFGLLASLFWLRQDSGWEPLVVVIGLIVVLIVQLSSDSNNKTDGQDNSASILSEYISENLKIAVFGIVFIAVLVALFSHFLFLNDYSNNKPLPRTKTESNEKQTDSIQNENKYLKPDLKKEMFDNTLSSDGVVNLSPDIISNSIIESPPYQRDNVAKSFLGLKVKWLVSLGNVKKRGNNQLKIYTYDSKTDRVSVRFMINSGDYPIIQVLKAGEKFTVLGKIIEAEEYGVELKIEDIVHE